MRKEHEATSMERRSGLRERRATLAVLLLCSMGAAAVASKSAAQQPQQDPAPVGAESEAAGQSAGSEVESAPRDTDAEIAEREALQRTLETELEQEREAAQRERAAAQLEREAQLEAQLEQQREAQQRQREAQQRQREAMQRQREAMQRERELRVAQREREREAAESEREGAERQRDIESARRELEEARRDLEAAAREVARLSAEAVNPVITDLRRQWLGTGQRAMLGIAIVDSDEGASVSAVSPGGPADEAGIQVGDVIVAIDGRSLTDTDQPPSRRLIAHLSEIEPGTPVMLGLEGPAGERVVSVVTRERDARIETSEGPLVQLEPLRQFFRFGASDRWSSMELVSLTPELGAYFGTERGLLVVRAPDDTSLMLRDGDVILDIGGREPNSPEHAMRILGTFEPGETVELTIMRDRQRQTLEIPVTNEETQGSERA